MPIQQCKPQKKQANNPQEPANYIRSNFTTGNGYEETRLGPTKGSLLQEGAHNTVPSSSERDPIVLGHQHLGCLGIDITSKLRSMHERHSLAANSQGNCNSKQ